jgi:glutamate-1-semialdehyde 2,1-aminomutase/spore coat polysaccharide biosynthesis protein SpsF
VIPYGHQSVGDDDVAAVNAVLRGDRLTQGPAVDAFEEALAAAVGARFAVAFSSGTAALHAAALAAGLGPGDTVVTSALTFVASAACARYVGATPAFADVDPDTLNLDPRHVPPCDALVVVHYAGLPVDLSALPTRPRVVIEDAAHALGAVTPDGPVGNCAHSDLCTFSFHPVKAITTGEGGAVTTNSPELAEAMRRLRHHGITPRPGAGAWDYDVAEIGFNYRLTDIQAALGRSQLAHLDEFVTRREALAARYAAGLDGTSVRLPPAPPPGWRHAWHLYPVRVPDRDRVYEELRGRGVGVQVHYVPLYRHTALERFAGAPGDYPGTEAAASELLSLPLYPAMSDGDQDTVIEAVLDVTADRRGAAAQRDPLSPPPSRRLDASRAWLERARAVIPAATQTLSKGPSQFVQGASPIYLARGRGAHVWDVDDNRYLDWPMALGPVLLGYADPVVDAAVRRQLEAGITFTLMHPLEVEVAERIVDLCPGVEAVRFAKSGSDAVAAAVRAARAATGRDVVVTAGYHGWHDWYVGTTDRSAGVPAVVAGLTASFEFNDLAGLEAVLDAHAGHVAAVVVEPSGADLPAPGFLQRVVDLARRHGAVSVFDEVITGFRLAPGGARQRYGVTPDLSCYGKALGNGMPVSAVAGSWDVMGVFEDVFFSTTHGGETLSLAAARAVLDAIADGSVLAGVEATGERLRRGLDALIGSHGVAARVGVGGEPHRNVVGFPGPDPLGDRSWVQQCLVERGILFNGSMFVCARHTEADVDRTLDAFDEAFAALAKHDDVRHLLAGPPVEPVFRA